MEGYRRIEWNAAIQAVNEELIPPPNTDCEGTVIAPLPPVAKRHRLSKADFQAVREKILATGAHYVFRPLEGRQRWRRSLIDDLGTSLGFTWPDCEPSLPYILGDVWVGPDQTFIGEVDGVFTYHAFLNRAALNGRDDYVPVGARRFDLRAISDHGRPDEKLWGTLGPYDLDADGHIAGLSGIWDWYITEAEAGHPGFIGFELSFFARFYSR